MVGIARTKEAGIKEIIIKEIAVKEEIKDIKIKVTQTMLELGMPAHLRVYHYLREAICLTIEDMELVSSITKLLYPEIAKRFHSTNDKVERAIRSVIEVGWQRGNEDVFEEILGYSRVHCKERPTNSEFIVAIADKLRLDLCV